MRLGAFALVGICACSFQAGNGNDAPPQLDAPRAVDAPPVDVIDAPKLVDAAPPIDAAPPAPPKCFADPGYVTLDASGHKYHLETTGYDYDTATDNCTALGAHLVVIDGSAENAVIATLGSGQQAWLGFDDLDVEGNFTWVNQSTSMFVNWAATQPNNNGGDEDCVLMNGGRWDDQTCGAVHPSVCECEMGYVAPAPRACRTQSGWSTLQGRRYKIVAADTWQNAEAACELQGAYLVALEDDKENGRLKPGPPGGLGATGDVWIGLARLGSGSGFGSGSAFTWVDGAQSPYMHWMPGQPDASPTHDCVLALGADMWGNNDCTSPHSGICECDPDPPRRAPAVNAE